MSKPKQKPTKKSVAEVIKQVAKISAMVDQKMSAVSKEMKDMVKVV